MAIDERALEVLLAKQEIRELHYKYCRAVDRADGELMRTLFHDDAVIHHQPWFDGPARDYVDMAVKNARGQMSGSWSHMATNELTTVEADQASSEWYLFQYDRITGKDFDRDLILCGRFLERLSRRNGVWKVSERALVRDVVRFDPVGETWSPAWPKLSDGVSGKSSREDISYQYMLDDGTGAAARDGMGAPKRPR
ncbi:MAG TPA: nuclear transport factor 2 family protein [Burkholderiales bacterium]|nr:nuclear transport factor 2 family protein [Burkholderiales bacterium]